MQRIFAELFRLFLITSEVLHGFGYFENRVAEIKEEECEGKGDGFCFVDEGENENGDEVDKKFGAGGSHVVADEIFTVVNALH